MTYTLFKLGPVPVAGAMPLGPLMGSLASDWSTYFAVKDADEAVRLGVELGATLCRTFPGSGASRSSSRRKASRSESSTGAEARKPRPACSPALAGPHCALPRGAVRPR